MSAPYTGGLTIPNATPSGMDLGLRLYLGNASASKITLTLYQGDMQAIAVLSIPVRDVMVGKITDTLHCLFIGPAAIDITPAAAEAVNAWLAQLIEAAA